MKLTDKKSIENHAHSTAKAPSPRRLRTNASMVALFLCFCLQGGLDAWWPTAHYSIAREGGFPHSEAALFNLPDAWKSYELIYTGETFVRIFAITDDFCWSHGVAKTGRCFLVIPKKPAHHYPEHCPGKLIQDAVNAGKVQQWGPGASIDTSATDAKALNTATYLIGHNAADFNVHWAYFSGADDTMSFEQCLASWTTNHRIKEEWADYAVLKMTQKIVFDPSTEKISSIWGNAIPATGQAVPFDVSMVNCYALRLSQLAARKNRFRIEDGNVFITDPSPYCYHSVNSYSDILSKVTALADSVNDDIRNMRKERWLKLRKTAYQEGWMKNNKPGADENDYTVEEEYDDFSDLNAIYDNSVNLFKERLGINQSTP